ncbi:MAG: hypothetical protein ACI8RD_006823, partial [Bacillariaceae sp.]
MDSYLSINQSNKHLLASSLVRMNHFEVLKFSRPADV